jgi:hypothetical protein
MVLMSRVRQTGAVCWLRGRRCDAVARVLELCWANPENRNQFLLGVWIGPDDGRQGGDPLWDRVFWVAMLDSGFGPRRVSVGSLVAHWQCKRTTLRYGFDGGLYSLRGAHDVR